MSVVLIPVPVEPSWCETHDCQCPCHSEPATLTENLAFWSEVVLCVIAIFWVMWTLMAWMLGSENQTLSGILVSQWHWLKGLAGRIY